MATGNTCIRQQCYKGKSACTMSSLQPRTYLSRSVQFAKSNFTLAVECWAPSGSIISDCSKGTRFSIRDWRSKALGNRRGWVQECQSTGISSVPGLAGSERVPWGAQGHALIMHEIDWLCPWGRSRSTLRLCLTCLAVLQVRATHERCTKQAGFFFVVVIGFILFYYFYFFSNWWCFTLETGSLSAALADVELVM